MSTSQCGTNTRITPICIIGTGTKGAIISIRFTRCEGLRRNVRYFPPWAAPRERSSSGPRRLGVKVVTGCRATQSDTTETCALLQRPSSISPYRRAADHQVREVACIGIGVPTPVPLRETTQAEFSTIRGLETSAQVRDCNMLNWTSCYRKTYFHLHNGVKQRLAAEADRAVVNGPSKYCIMCTCGAQAILSDHQPMKSPCGLPRFTISRQYA